MNKNHKKQTKNTQNSESKLEKSMISRLRTNTVEFAQLVRGSITDSNTGATTAQGYSFFLNYPGYYFGPSSTIALLPNKTSLLADESKVFDEYKVTKLTVKYLPWVTEQARVNTSVAFTAPVDPTLIMSVDQDDYAPFTSLSQALGSQNPAIYHSYSSSIKEIAMRQKDRVDAGKWLNFQARIPSTSTPPDPNNPAKISAVKVWKAGYQLASTSEGTFYAEWIVILRGSYTLA